ncbi:MAG TPA: hypothetical protein IAA75_02730 [Candidatus Pullichristensenella avicola]|nr:hypothetical protein [Candidatus Pullichristensenella avicola]
MRNAAFCAIRLRNRADKRLAQRAKFQNAARARRRLSKGEQHCLHRRRKNAAFSKPVPRRRTDTASRKLRRAWPARKSAHGGATFQRAKDESRAGGDRAAAFPPRRKAPFARSGRTFLHAAMPAMRRTRAGLPSRTQSAVALVALPAPQISSISPHMRKERGKTGERIA